ncbi:hypothetical protein GEMRC1_005938 [Eukaryota sp. GEM-RC1]
MMAMISPALESFNESLSTLKFANRAKNIKNEASINEDLDQKALLRKYERELAKLRSQLQQKSQNVVDKRKLLELEEQKRRAEEDKLAALVALESRSKEFLLEKQEKKKLEEKITTMQSQLLGHGSSGERKLTAISTSHNDSQNLQRFYESKLAELDRERQSLQADKDQIEQYKQLLLKQRDIMIALTARLNERDETIMLLEEELELYQGKHMELEEQLDEKMLDVITTQKMLAELKGQSGGDVYATLLTENESLKAENSNLNTLLQTRVEELVKTEVQEKADQLKSTVNEYEKLVGSLKNKIKFYENFADRQSGDIDTKTLQNFDQLKRYAESFGAQHSATQPRPSLVTSPTPPPEFGSQQLQKFTKEREALKTILEMKIRVLVDNVALCLSSNDINQARSYIDVLKKFVNAAVIALQTSDSKTAPSSTQNLRPVAPETPRKIEEKKQCGGYIP